MNDYEKIRVLARGAFGIVHLSKRVTDSRHVVIKEILMDSKLDRNTSAVEVKVLKMLKHPNIIQLYDSFILNNCLMMVMEYATGGTLNDIVEKRLANCDPFPEETIAHLFAQIVIALDYVHGRQILHRDLKSQNIFLTKDQNHVKVGDFGISKILTSKSKAHSVVGTPCYISPELCNGKAYDQKSDVWSLGCLLFEMAALKRAFEAPNLPALVLKITKGEVTSLPTIYSQTLDRLVHWLLAIDPDERPNIVQVIAHHWVAPFVYKLPTSLGAIHRTNDATSPMYNRKVCSPTPRPWGCVVDVDGGAKPRPICQEIVEVTSSKMGVTRSGKVVNIEGESIEPLGDTIKVVSMAESGKFRCYLTDRGIVMMEGILGDKLISKKPKIVEQLLVYSVSVVSCTKKYFCCGADDGKIFLMGKFSTTFHKSPVLIDTIKHGKPSKILCSVDLIAVLMDNGDLLTVGKTLNAFAKVETSVTDFALTNGRLLMINDRHELVGSSLNSNLAGINQTWTKIAATNSQVALVTTNNTMVLVDIATNRK